MCGIDVNERNGLIIRGVLIVSGIAWMASLKVFDNIFNLAEDTRLIPYEETTDMI